MRESSHTPLSRPSRHPAESAPTRDTTAGEIPKPSEKMTSRSISPEVQAILPYVDDTKLGSSDMFNVEDEVLDVAPKWEKFGGALGLDSRVLNRIKAESSSTEDGLHKTLQEFLKMNYETQVHGQPSWQLIVKALAHRNGGNDKELALEVAKEHSTAPPASSGNGTSGSGANITTADCAKAENKAILKQRPDLRKLIMIPYRVDGLSKQYRPTREIAPHWEDVVTYLDVSQAAIVNARGRHSATDSVREALQHWIASNVEASWSKLIKAMKTVSGLKVSAGEFRTALLNIAEDDSDDD